MPPFLSLHPCKSSAAATKSLQQFLPLGSVVCTWCVCCTRHRKAESRESRQASSEKMIFHELETELYWLLLRFVNSGALVAPTMKHSTVANWPNRASKGRCAPGTNAFPYTLGVSNLLACCNVGCERRVRALSSGTFRSSAASGTQFPNFRSR